MPDQPEVIRCGAGRSVQSRALAALWGAGGLAMAVAFIATSNWNALVLIVPWPLAIGWIFWRAGRCRFEIRPDRLVVVNTFVTTNIRRAELLAVADQKWSDLQNVTRTVDLQTVDGRSVRVIALARALQSDTELREHAQRIERWRLAGTP